MNEATTYYLQMSSPSELIAVDDARGLLVAECTVKQFEYNRFLYALVGAQWAWTDKLSWTDRQSKRFAANKRNWLG